MFDDGTYTKTENTQDHKSLHARCLCPSRGDEIGIGEDPGITCPSNTSGTTLYNKSRAVFPFFLCRVGVGRGVWRAPQGKAVCLPKNPQVPPLPAKTLEAVECGPRLSLWRQMPARLPRARAASPVLPLPPSARPSTAESTPLFFPPIFVSSYVYHILSSVKKIGRGGGDAVCSPASFPRRVRSLSDMQLQYR